MKVAVYARFATEQQLGIETQVEQVRRFIAQHDGWELAKVYAETASARPLESRSELNHLLDDAKNGEFQKVVTVSASRMARNMVDLIDLLKELKESGISVETIKEGELADPLLRKEDAECLKLQ